MSHPSPFYKNRMRPLQAPVHTSGAPCAPADSICPNNRLLTFSLQNDSEGLAVTGDLWYLHVARSEGEASTGKPWPLFSTVTKPSFSLMVTCCIGGLRLIEIQCGQPILMLIQTKSTNGRLTKLYQEHSSCVQTKSMSR